MRSRLVRAHSSSADSGRQSASSSSSQDSEPKSVQVGTASSKISLQRGGLACLSSMCLIAITHYSMLRAFADFCAASVVLHLFAYNFLG